MIQQKLKSDLMKLRWMKRDIVSNKQLTCVGCLDSVSSLGSAGHAESWAGRTGSEDTGACRRACAVHHPVSCARRPAPGGVRTITECGQSLYLPEPCTSRALQPGFTHMPVPQVPGDWMGMSSVGKAQGLFGSPTCLGFKSWLGCL